MEKTEHLTWASLPEKKIRPEVGFGKIIIGSIPCDCLRNAEERLITKLLMELGVKSVSINR